MVNTELSDARDEHVKVLHLSDLHVGMTKHSFLWPTFKNAFFDDLRRLFAKLGPWDLVVFSGDLTQQADPEEFRQLTGILQEMWELFETLGFSPLFFPIPGNHDLLRPPELSAAAKVLGGWWSDPKLQDAFWSDPKSEYRKLIRSSFDGYSHWLQSLGRTRIPLLHDKDGIIPGDASGVLSVRGLRIGIVGLNSAWLQLNGGKFQGYLHVDLRQLQAVTNSDPDNWCHANDFNLILTHHPTEWLHSQSRESWRSEIHTNERFDCHLFGHMHEPNTMSISEGGASLRRTVQAASLFGLETIMSSGDSRIHGFSLLSLRRDIDRKCIRMWPRKALLARDGTRKIIPDHEFNLDDGGSFELGASTRRDGDESTPTTIPAIVSLSQPRNSARILDNIRRTLYASNSFLDIRRMEQAVGLAALQASRAMWVVSDWGLGTDEFIYTLQKQLPVEASWVLELDAHAYSNRLELLAGVHEQVGCSFEQLCELVSLTSPCLLVLDVSIGERGDTGHALQKDIELISSAVLQYCANVRLIVKSRRVPLDCSIKVVELRPLDEADTAVYVTKHEHVGRSLATPQFASQIFRHTDGIPARIEALLRDLPIVGTSSLYRLNPDVTGHNITTASVAPGLVASINDMRASPDPGVKRAFDLLKALAMFPRGEQFATLKRFNGTSGFYSQDVRTLMDWAFVDAVEVPHVARGPLLEDGKALVVRRAVREYLYSVLSPVELRLLNKRSLSLYFGDEWSVKGMNPPKHLRFGDRNCGNWKIGNASMMVLRCAREAADSDSQPKIRAVLDLSTSFCAALIRGDHFGSVVALCNDLVPIFDAVEVCALNTVMLRVQWAKSLRMSGENAHARDIFEDIRKTSVAQQARQDILLNLALCYERLGDNGLALSVAEECAKIDLKTDWALHAQSIVVGLHAEDPDRDRKLRKIEADARKRKAFIVANNVALTRADESEDKAERRRILEVVASHEGNDHYNRLDAFIQVAKIVLDEGGELEKTDLSKLVDGYHYLYGESFKSLFNSCHEVLWRAFEHAGETANLISLFRYSSLTWRLRGEPEREQQCLNRLGKIVGHTAKGSFDNADREMAYFLARAGDLTSRKTRLKAVA